MASVTIHSDFGAVNEAVKMSPTKSQTTSHTGFTVDQIYPSKEVQEVRIEFSSLQV